VAIPATAANPLVAAPSEATEVVAVAVAVPGVLAAPPAATAPTPASNGQTAVATPQAGTAPLVQSAPVVGVTVSLVTGVTAST
jgi:hypothetical protein